VLGAPLLNRGRFSLFANSLDQYSTLTTDLVRESTVIDMLGLITLDFKKLAGWRAQPESFRPADFQRLKDSGITVFHPAVGYVDGDIYAESSADITRWDAFIDAHPEYFIRVGGPGDVTRAKAEGKLGIIVGQQNSNHFARSMTSTRSTSWGSVFPSSPITTIVWAGDPLIPRSAV